MHTECTDGEYREKGDILTVLRRDIQRDLGCRFVEAWMRTAEARLLE
jgi:hypothetical protein